MTSFCTLFDSRYLSRALALYESLSAQPGSFHFYIFALDEACFEVLTALSLPATTIISARQFEDPQLLAVKSTRSPAEYCWTCTPTVIRYILDTYNTPSCTYLDADLYFFASPQVLLAELGDGSVLITEHRYSPCYDQSDKCGKYCVQFITFRNNPDGRRVLEWWRQACIAWCYNRCEPGRFGDQKYLDDWPQKFQGVHVLSHLGGGLGPWNVQQYDFLRAQNRLLGRRRDTSREFAVIFYHFHHLKFFTNGLIDLGGYRLSATVRNLIYKPYIRHLDEITSRIQPEAPAAEPVTVRCGLKGLARYAKHRLMSNILRKDALLEGV
jgi:hypothetical protein